MRSFPRTRVDGPALAWLLVVLVGAFAWAAALAEEGPLLDWPREITRENVEILIYQPQIEEYTRDRIEARAAVSVKTTDMEAPLFGAMWFVGRLATDLEERIVVIANLEVTAARFPDVDEDKVETLSTILEEEFTGWEMTMSLDRLIASLDASGHGASAADELRNDPPAIVFSTVPAVLVLTDGEPILADIEGYEAEYVVNTAFFIVKDQKSGAYFLKGGDHWYQAEAVLGPWSVVPQLPASMQDIAQRVAEEEEQQQESQQQTEASEDQPQEPADDEPVPVIIVRTEPTEVVQTDGQPDYASIAGTQLLYLKNTDSDVIMDIAEQQYYVLLSGRWYRSASMENGPWSHVASDDLPADFAAIPAESDLAGVRSSVTGTQEAREAVLENTIPQTAEIDRKTASCEVVYDGDPRFESCADAVRYATNSDKPVLLIHDNYYCCDNAVWFVSQRPDEAWQVSTEVPAEIQEIPPECQVYNDK